MRSDIKILRLQKKEIKEKKLLKKERKKKRKKVKTLEMYMTYHRSN